MKKLPPKYKMVQYFDYSAEEAKEIEKNIKKGNIPAILDLVLHNQGLLNWKSEEIMRGIKENKI